MEIPRWQSNLHDDIEAGRCMHIARSEELQVVEPIEVGKPKQANEGDKNLGGNHPKEQEASFLRALEHKTCHWDRGEDEKSDEVQGHWRSSGHKISMFQKQMRVYDCLKTIDIERD